MKWSGTAQLGVFTLALVVACSFGDGGIEGSGPELGGTGADASTSGDAASGRPTEDSNSDSGGGGMGSATGVGDTQTVDDTSNSRGADDDDNDNDDDISDDGDTTSSTDTGPVDDTTTGVDVQIEQLQNVSFADCSQPLWCFNGNIFNGTGDAQTAIECFTASLPPPFEVAEVEFYVADDDSDMGSFDFEVRGWNGGPPGNVLAMVPIASNSISLGMNTIEPPAPITIQTPGFCVGFATPQGMEVGFGVDVGSACGPGTSFQTLLGSGSCNVVEAETCSSMPTPTANWCFGATIEKPAL